MAAKLDRVINSLQRSLNRERDNAFRRGMYYPTRWDPSFREYMTLADVYRYPGQHYDHHRRQLTLHEAELTGVPPASMAIDRVGRGHVLSRTIDDRRRYLQADEAELGSDQARELALALALAADELDRWAAE